MQDVKQQIAKGAVWMILLRIADQGMGVVGIVVLARLLTPTDFAILAMALSVVEVTELLRTFGFDWAIIQKQKNSRALYDTAWTLNVIFAALTAATLIAVAVPAARFFGEPRLPLVITCLALGSFVHGLENIGVVAFRKDLDFDKEFKYRFVVRLAQFVTTIALAIPVRGYWALVGGALASHIMAAVYSYSVHPYRPRFSVAARAEVFQFSSWLFVHNVFGVGIRRSADFVLGRLAAASSLGLFRVGFRVSNFATSELALPINRALFPGYSRMSGDLALFRDSFLKMVQVVFLYTIPAGVGIAAIAELLEVSLLGEKWAGTAAFVRVLGLYGSIAAIESHLGMVHLGLGRSRTLSNLTLSHLVLLVPMQLLFVGRVGAVGVAWAYLAAAFVLLPFYCSSTMATLGIHLKELLSNIWRPVLASALMYSVVRTFVLRVAGLTSGGDVLFLVAAVCLGAVSYAVAVFALWWLSSKPDGGERVLVTKLVLPAVRRVLAWRGAS